MREALLLERPEERRALDGGPPGVAGVRRLVVPERREDLRELPLERIRLVAPVPDQGERAARAEDAVDLGERLAGREPVKGLRDRDRVGRGVMERHRLRRSLERFGQVDPRAHRGDRLDERQRIEERLRRLNELGYDVEEIEVVGEGDELRLRLHPQVVEPGHHARRLYSLTGLDVQENQARRLLNDIASYRAALARIDGGRKLPESVAAYRWRTQIFDPSIAAVPAGLRGKREPAEIFHEILEHRWLMSEKAGREGALPLEPDEQRLLSEGPIGGA